MYVLPLSGRSKLHVWLLLALKVTDYSSYVLTPFAPPETYGRSSVPGVKTYDLRPEPERFSALIFGTQSVALNPTVA